jgi:hypothetical protein
MRKAGVGYRECGMGIGAALRAGSFPNPYPPSPTPALEP